MALSRRNTATASRSCSTRRSAFPSLASDSAWTASSASYPGWVTSSPGSLSAHHPHRRMDARRSATSPSLAWRVNIGIDVIVGTIPFFGDAFDIAWKTNRRNYAAAARATSDSRAAITWKDWASSSRRWRLCSRHPFAIPIVLRHLASRSLLIRRLKPSSGQCAGINPFRDTIKERRRGVAQSGSASALGAEGRGFESLRPDHPINLLERIPILRIKLQRAGFIFPPFGDHWVALGRFSTSATRHVRHHGIFLKRV